MERRAEGGEDEDRDLRGFHLGSARRVLSARTPAAWPPGHPPRYERGSAAPGALDAHLDRTPSHDPQSAVQAAGDRRLNRTLIARGTASIFPEGQAGAYFDGPEECMSRIDYYLSREDERVEIARAAHRIVEHHTYLDRAREIIQHYGETDR
ncbi:MAG: glycosyltransferase family 1 protein [Planctomycetaceae bacterium]|nr:glycosyltransferase family 1 protein [Planctomycetaceae bacterium]